VVTSHGKPVAVISGIDAADLGRIGPGGGRPAGWIAERAPEWFKSAAEGETFVPSMPSAEPPPAEKAIGPGWGGGREGGRDWNPLKAVFWDYPGLTNEAAVRELLESARRAPDGDAFRWIMSRFLERGRVVDVKKLFPWNEIRAVLPRLKLSPYARKKWIRMLEVYDRT